MVTIIVDIIMAIVKPLIWKAVFQKAVDKVKAAITSVKS